MSNNLQQSSSMSGSMSAGNATLDARRGSARAIPAWRSPTGHQSDTMAPPSRNGLLRPTSIHQMKRQLSSLSMRSNKSMTSGGHTNEGNTSPSTSNIDLNEYSGPRRKVRSSDSDSSGDDDDSIYNDDDTKGPVGAVNEDGSPKKPCCRLCMRPRKRAIALNSSSFFVLAGDNPIRIFLYNLIHTKVFEAIVIVVIMMNSILLALDPPVAEDEERPAYQVNFDYFFVAAFSTEMILKMLALGVIGHPGAYLRNSWNILDFVIVILSYLAFIDGVGNYSAIRTLRVLRPLRSMNAVPQLRTIVIGLIHSIKGLANVLLLSAFIFGIFGILAVQLWNGNFNMRCREVSTGVVDEERFCRNDTLAYGSLIGRTCDAGFECIKVGNPNHGMTSFDNVLWAFLVIVQCITLEGWALIMYSTMDHSGWYTAAYFVLLIVIGSYFVLNLALAVINFEFLDAKKRYQQEQDDLAFEEEKMARASEDAVKKFGQSFKVRRESMSMAGLDETIPPPPAPKKSFTRKDMIADLLDFRSAIKDEEARKEAKASGPATKAPSASHHAKHQFDHELLEIDSNKGDDELGPQLTSHGSTNGPSMGGEEVMIPTIEDDQPSMTDASEPQMSSFYRSFMWLRYGMFWATEGDPSLHMSKIVDDEQLARKKRSEKNVKAEGKKKGKKKDTEDSVEVPTPFFVQFIVFCIFANTIILAAEHHNQSELQTTVSEWINFAFTLIFGVEMVMKLIALTPIGYVSDNFNVFDGIITVVSLVELGLSGGTGGGGTFSVLRTFRLLRVFRLLKNFPSLRGIVEVCLEAIKETGYLNIIILLYLFITALVGMQLFGRTFPREGEDALRSTFDNFLWSFYTVFQILTRDTWPDIMWLAMKLTNTSASLFFLFCVFAGDFVILNLFLAILISTFDKVGDDGGSDDEEEEVILDDGLQQNMQVTLVSKTVGQFLGGDLSKEGDDDANNGKLPLITANSDIILGDEASTRFMSSATDFDHFMKGETGNENICPNCGDPIVEPFDPLGKNIKKITPEALHSRMCEKIQFRKVREKAIADMLADYGADTDDEADGESAGDDGSVFAATESDSGDIGKKVSFMKGGGAAITRGGYVVKHPRPTPKLVEEAFGRAWEVSLLLGERLDDYLYMTEWSAFRKLLKEEREVLGMRVGEEQVGRALIAYTKANVPTEFTTNGGESLWVFGPKNPIRIGLTVLATHPAFDKVILVCIIASSILMAADNPRNPQQWNEDASNAFTAVFVAEAVVKIIAFGFILHPTAYLRDSWNILDFFIVCVSVLSWILVASNVNITLNFLKVLRTFRALRPLRVVNRNRGIKMVVTTLLQSIKGIANVALISLLVYLVFAIMGVQFFKGGMYRCTDEAIHARVNCTGTYGVEAQIPRNVSRNVTLYNDTTMENYTVVVWELSKVLKDTIVTQQPREWVNADFHFDDTYSSLLALFHAATLDNWAETMFNAIDITDVDHGPVRDNVPYRGLFFVVFIIIGSFFLLNMFVGVIIFNFNQVKEEMDGSSMLTQEQKLWVETQRMMLNFRPERKLKPGKTKLRIACFYLCMNPLFEVVTGVAILVNIILIGSEHYGQSDDYTMAMYIANIGFAIAFLAEAVLKILAFGSTYFANGWNRFDFFIVLVSFIDIGLDGTIPVNVGVLRALRVFRIMRMLSLVKKAKDVRILLETLWYSLPSLANIGAFLILIFFIYAVLGVQIFALVKREGGLTYHTNFEEFGTAFLFLIQVATLDNWGEVMISLMNRKDCGPDTNPEGHDDCGTDFAPLYFTSFIILAGFVMVNLFVAIILDNFNTTMWLDKSTLKMSDLKKFADAWALFDENATMLVETKRFPRLLAALKPPLGIARTTDRMALLKQTERFSIPEHGGVIHFVETLIPLARQVLGIEFSDTDIRDHEDHWKLQFPDLNNLQVLRYRQRRVTIDQYFAATFIGSAQRRRRGNRQCEQLRAQRRRDIKRWYDNNNVAEKDRVALHQMDRQRQEREARQALTEQLMAEYAARRQHETAEASELGIMSQGGEHAHEYQSPFVAGHVSSPADENLLSVRGARSDRSSRRSSGSGVSHDELDSVRNTFENILK